MPVGDAEALADKLKIILQPGYKEQNQKVAKTAIETGRSFTNGSVMRKWCKSIDEMIIKQEKSKVIQL